MIVNASGSWGNQFLNLSPHAVLLLHSPALPYCSNRRAPVSNTCHDFSNFIVVSRNKATFAHSHVVAGKKQVETSPKNLIFYHRNIHPRITCVFNKHQIICSTSDMNCPYQEDCPSYVQHHPLISGSLNFCSIDQPNYSESNINKNWYKSVCISGLIVVGKQTTGVINLLPSGK